MAGLTNWYVVRRRGGMVSSHGCLIDTNDPAVTPWVRSLIFWGFYERPELRFVRRYLRAHLDVVELGGSLGVVTAQIGRRLEPGRRLVSVEANPDLIELLEKNANRNAPALRLTVLNRAIAYSGTPVDFVEISFGNSNLAAWISQPSERSRARRIPVATLSGLLASHEIGPYALVSDIEGAEAGFLLRDPAALDRCALLIIELHDTEFEGRRLSIADLVRIVTQERGFALVESRKDVYVFKSLKAVAEPGSSAGAATAAGSGL